MNKKLTETITHISNLPISEERKKVLQPLVDYVQEKLNTKEAININFICTHNSRRSHLGQIWMQALANHFKLSSITSYSGGTEATALAKPIISTLVAQGFEIEHLSTNENPVYSIRFDKTSHPVIGFSKKYHHPFNPTSNFGAIMTCSQADEGCPFVAGSDKRIPITYEDPKVSDSTPLEAATYLERSEQIASEIYYTLSQLK